MWPIRALWYSDESNREKFMVLSKNDQTNRPIKCKCTTKFHYFSKIKSLVYSYFGELASESYSRMCNCVFVNLNWCKFPIELQKYILFMVMNMQKPISYYGFRYITLDLETFALSFFCRNVGKQLLITWQWKQSPWNKTKTQRFIFSVIDKFNLAHGKITRI